MAFDQNQPGPLVKTGRKTTQVNLFMAAAIVLFFIAAAITVWVIWRDPPQSPAETRTLNTSP